MHVADERQPGATVKVLQLSDLSDIMINGGGRGV